MYHYEDPSLQQEALNVIPVSELKQKAKEACEKSKENGQDGVDEKDCLFLEVVHWFGMNAWIFSIIYFVVIVGNNYLTLSLPRDLPLTSKIVWC